jgi:hypothetical protein
VWLILAEVLVNFVINLVFSLLEIFVELSQLSRVIRGWFVGFLNIDSRKV